jgi:hypothetical protein
MNLHCSRGLVEKDFEEIAVFIDRAIKITADLKKAHPEHKLKDFKDLLLQVRCATTVLCNLTCLAASVE